MNDHNAQAYDFAMKLTKDALARGLAHTHPEPAKPVDEIRARLGMRDHAAEALGWLEEADKQLNDGLETKALTRSLIHSNFAILEALRVNRHLEGWAGMEGNE